MPYVIEFQLSMILMMNLYLVLNLFTETKTLDGTMQPQTAAKRLKEQLLEANISRRSNDSNYKCISE